MWCHCYSFFFFSCYVDHRVLHSFPTRRSSDLFFVLSILVLWFGPQVIGHFGGIFKHHWMLLSGAIRSEEHTSELQSQSKLVCRLLLEKKKNKSWSAIWPSSRSGPYSRRCSIHR